MRSAALPVGRGAAQGGAGAGPGLGSNPEPPPPRTRLCLARAPPRFLGGPVVSLLSCSVSFAASSPRRGQAWSQCQVWQAQHHGFRPNGHGLVARRLPLPPTLSLVGQCGTSAADPQHSLHRGVPSPPGAAPEGPLRLRGPDWLGAPAFVSGTSVPLFLESGEVSVGFAHQAQDWVFLLPAPRPAGVVQHSPTWG